MMKKTLRKESTVQKRLKTLEKNKKDREPLMRERYREMPEIVSRRKIYRLRVYDDSYDLVYKINEYIKIKDQSKVYSDNLRKRNIRVRYFNPEGLRSKKWSIKYKPYAEKEYDIEHRKKTVNKILSKKLQEGISLEDKINKEWFDINCHKTSQIALNDENSKILDNLASYLLVGSESEYDLLSREDEKENARQELPLDVVENYESATGNWTIGVVDSIRLAKDHKKNREQEKRNGKKWQNSKTYRLNNIYSYDNRKNEKFFYNWVTGEIMGYDLMYHHKIDRLIDPEKPYVALWCHVNTENIFTFKNKKYKINKKVKQYGKRRRNIRYDDYRLDYLMDKILVIEQDDKTYFYDQDIFKIDLKHIENLGCET